MKGYPGTSRDGTAGQLYIFLLLEVPIFRKKSDFFVVASCFLNLKQEKDVLKQEKDVLKQEKDLLKQKRTF